MDILNLLLEGEDPITHPEMISMVAQALASGSLSQHMTQNFPALAAAFADSTAAGNFGTVIEFAQQQGRALPDCLGPVPPPASMESDGLGPLAPTASALLIRLTNARNPMSQMMGIFDELERGPDVDFVTMRKVLEILLKVAINYNLKIIIIIK